MSTPRIEPPPPGDTIIGLWRYGNEDDRSDRARLYTFEPLGFPGSRTRLIVGKDPTADLQIDGDSLISGHHFELRAVRDEVFIRDIGSANGTRINGVPLRQRERLEVDMRIACGLTELVAVDKALELRVAGASYSSFLRNAAEAYGSPRAAGKKIGKSHMTIWRAMRR